MSRKSFAPAVGGLFFPQSKSLGIDRTHFSPALQAKIIFAGTRNTSYKLAEEDLHGLADLDVSDKYIRRLCKTIGAERVAERDAQVAGYEAKPLTERKGVPEGVAAPNLAAVGVDGGRMQIFERVAKGQEAKAASVPAEEEIQDDVAVPEPAVTAKKPMHWREDKVGLALTMQSTVSESDPFPEIPKTFLDPKRVAKIVRGLKKSSALRVEEEEAATDQGADSSGEVEPEELIEQLEYKGPKLEKRRVVASRQSWPIFGVMLACLAWMSGFAPAKRKAFVADGARAIWRVWKSRFSSYTPILDFIHAMSYVYAAAKALGGDSKVEGWRLYVEWIRWVWKGNVAAVIERLETWQQEHGSPEKSESATTVRSVIAKSLRYLRNNQDKMKYAEYRKQGLPVVSSLVESMVKQISRRVKGTEKFWGEEGAEAILELRADYLSDGEIMETFWMRRQAAATGQRCYRARS